MRRPQLTYIFMALAILGASQTAKAEVSLPLTGIWQSEYVTVNPAPFLTKVKMRTEWDEEQNGLHVAIIIYVFVFGDEEIFQEDYFFHQTKFTDLGNGLLRVDLKVEQVLDTIFGQDSVDGQNDDKICGFSDWLVGVPKDITGRDCSFPEDGPGTTLIAEKGASAHLLLELSGADLKMREWVMAGEANRIDDWPEIPMLLPVVEGWQ